MKRLLVAVTACTPATDPPWRLDHDRVVAVRVQPPHLLPGQIAMLDALLAHADGPTTVEAPVGAASKTALLFTAVHFYIDHWQVDGPSEAELADARTQLGLDAGAPVPLDMILEFPGGLLAQKTVWFGDTHDNPATPSLEPQHLSIGEHALPVDTGALTPRWLTSCGTLEGDDSVTPRLIITEPCSGELALVVRDDTGGVAWHVVPVRAE